MNDDEWQRHVDAFRADIQLSRVTPQSILRRVRNADQELPTEMDEMWATPTNDMRQARAFARNDGSAIVHEDGAVARLPVTIPTDSNILVELLNVTPEDARRAITENGGNLTSAIEQLTRTQGRQNTLAQNENEERPEMEEWSRETDSSNSSDEESEAYPVGPAERPALRRQPSRHDFTAPDAPMQTASIIARNILRRTRHVMANSSAETAYDATRILQSQLEIMAERLQLQSLRGEELHSLLHRHNSDQLGGSARFRNNQRASSVSELQTTTNNAVQDSTTEQSNTLVSQRLWLDQWRDSVSRWVQDDVDDAPPVNSRFPGQLPEAGGPMFRRQTQPLELPPVHTLVKTDATRTMICELIELMEGSQGTFPDLRQPDANFFCPLSLSAMHDPVVAVDGIMYENAWATRHLFVNGITSPTTRAPMHSSYLTRSTTMRSMMENWASATADALIWRETRDEKNVIGISPLTFLERMQTAIAYVKSRL